MLYTLPLNKHNCAQITAIHAQHWYFCMPQQSGMNSKEGGGLLDNLEDLEKDMD